MFGVSKYLGNLRGHNSTCILQGCLKVAKYQWDSTHTTPELPYFS